jgi:hypothetical protein
MLTICRSDVKQFYAAEALGPCQPESQVPQELLYGKNMAEISAWKSMNSSAHVRNLEMGTALSY